MRPCLKLVLMIFTLYIEFYKLEFRWILPQSKHFSIGFAGSHRHIIGNETTDLSQRLDS